MRKRNTIFLMLRITEQTTAPAVRRSFDHRYPQMGSFPGEGRGYVECALGQVSPQDCQRLQMARLGDEPHHRIFVVSYGRDLSSKHAVISVQLLGAAGADPSGRFRSSATK
jgi:hypothetical protein